MSNPTTLPLAQRITQGPVSQGTSRPYRIACVRPEHVAAPQYYVSIGDPTGGNGWPAGVHKTYTENADEWEANAELIAEAFNVTHETGLSPRQLAEERAELLDLLHRYDGYVRHDLGHTALRPKWLTEAFNKFKPCSQPPTQTH